MTEGSELIEVVEGEIVQLGSLSMAGPSAIIQQATSIASELSSIINAKKLYTTISGRKYVRVEGWTTLGAMLGVLPREDRCERIVVDDVTGYESYVSLVRVSDGATIGGASAVCLRSERNWANRDEYALRSMATTRATGKAYRLAFSWIITLAGYEPTPAEEMIGTVEEQPRHQQARGNGGKAARPLEPEKLKAMLAEKITHKPKAHQDGIATPGQQGLVTGKLNECFAPDADADDKRHAVSHWLTGKASVKELTMAEAGAILDWLLDKDADEGTYDLHPAASQEAQTVYRQIVKDAGQTEMEVGE
ncbi:MAG TPA: hypothetical protein VM537_27965 [Anaerolineae bacterium]|nr:hypothetical protein [Anaerolineae bacterium]